MSAAPRFLNLTSDAHTAVFNGTLGRIRAGIDGGDQVGSEQDCVDVFNSVMETDLVLAIPVGDGPGIKNLAANVDVAVTNNANICYYTFVSESKAVGFVAPQFRYLYTSGDVEVNS